MWTRRLQLEIVRAHGAVRFVSSAQNAAQSSGSRMQQKLLERKNMQALQKTAAEFGLEFREAAEPSEPAPDDVILQVAAAGICGSDVHIYDWSGGYDFLKSAFPVTIGHEFSGTVFKTGAAVHDLQ